VRAGKIRHDHLFFKSNGEPIRNLQYPYVRWVKTFARLPTLRYRKPYCARHSSVSWDLVLGHSPLWVARQHGHSITTMLRVYAAWADGMVETDIEAIKQAMMNRPAMLTQPTMAQLEPFASKPVDLPLAFTGAAPSSSSQTELSGGERGITREAPRPFGAALRVLAKPTAPAFRHHGARYNEGLKRTLRALSLSVVSNT
jgi:hypothetical protein